MSKKIFVYRFDNQLKNENLNECILACYNGQTRLNPEYLIIDNINAFDTAVQLSPNSKIIFPKQLLQDPNVKTNGLFKKYLYKGKVVLLNKDLTSIENWHLDYLNKRFKLEINNMVEIPMIQEENKNKSHIRAFQKKSKVWNTGIRVIKGEKNSSPKSFKSIGGYKENKIDINDTSIDNHIILFGNDFTINDFDFDSIDRDKYIVAGVNRIWLKIKPDYLIFQDPPIIKEMYEQNYDASGIKFIIPNRFYDLFEKCGYEEKYLNYIKDNECYFFDIPKNLYPHTILASVYAFSEIIYKGKNNLFYLYGNNLKWNEDESHFWVKYDKFKKYEKRDKNKYEKLFNKSEKGFKKLKNEGFKIISCDEEGTLNKFLKYINKKILYKKEEIVNE